ncbi:hypothetical protein [Lentilactobacillus kisonensis]|uniref:Uncharacterized protein n=2 Tax=Lentilactobacillus kisonensis TaxID=481722 RepID=H1LFV7_9LACO|nr:hypothetical protein [Lentilactobacillus kisonensis]EHO51549.1 hypothetical protein HMPREF9104_01483 [Lentilactobacillus kisonensis F0435]KRL22911.1 hypothetical protein FC98_GL001665 [Lentilactobacillus kisonensis DSM 19906 = JCM 15041]
MNNAKEYLDFFNQEYKEPGKHSNYSTNSNFRFDTRADALEIKNMLLEKSPSAKNYLLSVEYINPNRSMQVGWYITIRKLDNSSLDSAKGPEKNQPTNPQKPTDKNSKK